MTEHPPPGPDRTTPSTASADYTNRLLHLQRRGFRRYVDVQLPYRWHLNRLNLGTTLDVGCGVGRNLMNLGATAVGVDHNPDSVAVAISRGLTALTSPDFHRSSHAQTGHFDTLLIAHVLEHIAAADCTALLREYLPYLRSGGRVVLICPQEAGYKTDATHVQWVDFATLDALCAAVGLRVQKRYSFPFPRPVGKVFPYNEFVCLAQKAD